jgi:hypothetical protein
MKPEKSNPFGVILAKPNYQKRLELFVAENFNCSNMSDTKWRKLFTLLAKSELGLTRCSFKFLGNDQIYTTRFPREDDLRRTMFDDNLDVRFRYYIELEWIEIPRKYQNSVLNNLIVDQDVEDAYNMLKKTGQFEMSLTETGLKIYGYS